MSWDAVRAWRDRLAQVDAATLGTGLSADGAREAFVAALEALSDDALADAAALPVDPVGRAVVVPASTVFTAPLEWCAVLLGRGTEVVVKRPRARAGLVDAMVALADGLPLSATDDRAEVGRAELVVAMGGDDAVDAIRGQLAPGARLAAHGHAWSLAWVVGDRWDGLADDLALHDGRGCLSPAVVLTPRPLDDVFDQLADALVDAERRWPRGALDPTEGVAIRGRGALARVLGRVRVGDGWAIHALPADRAVPVSLPRAPLVVRVADLDEAVAFARRWPALSTVGTDDPASADRWGASGRVCALGQMQRPPLRRRHDGVDWVLRETGAPRR